MAKFDFDTQNYKNETSMIKIIINTHKTIGLFLLIMRFHLTIRKEKDNQMKPSCTILTQQEHL